MGEQPERVGVTFKVDKVSPLRLGQFVAYLRSGPFAEKCRDGLLARMSERRISKVMGKTGGRHNLTHCLKLVTPRLVAILQPEFTAYLVGKRASHRCHLHGVGQTVVNEYASRQRKHLCLILQAPERRREDQPVKIALKVTARTALGVMIILKSQTLVIDEPVPMHHITVLS